MNHIFGTLFAAAMFLTADALPAVAQQTIKFDESESLEINDAPMMSVLGVLRHVGHRISFEEVRINTKKDYYFDEKGLLHWKKKKISLTINKNSKTQELLEELTNLDDSYTWFRVANGDYFVVHPTKRKNEASNESVLVSVRRLCDSDESVSRGGLLQRRLACDSLAGTDSFCEVRHVDCRKPPPLQPRQAALSERPDG